MSGALLLPADVGRPPSVVISAASYEALGGPNLWRLISTSTPGSAVWPAASTMIAYPFSVSQICIAVKMWLQNGATASGNIDIGLYTDAGTLIVSKGSTAQSGAGTRQDFDITDTALSPGIRYYMGLVMDGILGTAVRAVAGTAASQLAALGVVQVASNFPLVTGVTFAKTAQNYLPEFGLSRLVTF